MKKIIMMLLLIFIFLVTKEVKAQTYKLTLEKQNGIYYTREGDIVPYKSSQYYVYLVNNKIAYCIDPGSNITTYNYSVDGNEIKLNYSDEVKEKIQLIGYYGREYPTHDNVHYSMAAQALIWELTGAGKVSFWTGLNKTGEMIDIEKEKEEIMDLVNEHTKLPNIPLIVDGYYNERITLEDSNNVISNYEIETIEENSDTYIEDNKIHIYSRMIGNSTITLKKKRYDNFETTIFVGSDKDNSQVLGILRFQNDLKLTINVKMKGIKIKINKRDENFKFIKIKGIKFKIKDLQKNEYLCENTDCTFETNDNGIAISDGLDFGTYEVEEVENQIVSGYLWNPKKYQVSIRREGPIYYNEEYGHFVEVNFKNEKVVGTIEIHKLGEEFNIIDNNVVYQKKPLEKVEFMLYDNEDNFITNLITDSNGNASLYNLDVGKYYLVEKNKINGYIKDNNKYYFEIKQKNQYEKDIVVKLEIVNYLQKGHLIINKKDFKNNSNISNTTFKIYNLDGEVLFTKTTDINGQIQINDLPIGKYYLKEIEANSKYLLMDDIMYFDINNNEVTTVTITNEKIEVDVPNTKKEDTLIINFLFIFLMIIMGAFYVQKERY